MDGPGVTLERSDDGAKFTRIKLEPATRAYTFPTQRARYYRVVLWGAPNKPENAAMRELALGTPAEVERRIQMAAKRSLNMLLTRPVYTDALALVFEPLAPLPDDQPLSSQAMVDLTGKLTVDGTLDWTPPPGRWRVVWLCRACPTGWK